MVSKASAPAPSGSGREREGSSVPLIAFAVLVGAIVLGGVGFAIRAKVLRASRGQAVPTPPASEAAPAAPVR